MLDPQVIEKISREVSVPPPQVSQTIDLFDGGATIPFVARYRKDVTGHLDEVQLEAIAERSAYYAAMGQRRASILDTIEKQGKLTDELRAAIENCDDKNALEDLYLPYKKQRRTKATVAREQGLEPLAEFLHEQVEGEKSIEEFAASFVSAEQNVASVEDALQGARHILAEKISMDADARSFVRTKMAEEGKLATYSTKVSEGQKTKYTAYYDYSEKLDAIPSHRLLAILRGVKESVLRMELLLDDEAVTAHLDSERIINGNSDYAPHIKLAVEDAYKRLIRPSIENEVVAQARKKAETQAIHVFRENAYSLLLAPPVGRLAVIGLDPGLKTGCKLAVIDDTGTFKENATLFLQASDDTVNEAKSLLKGLIKKYTVRSIAIGNGTGSREASAFVKEVLQELGDTENKPFSLLVNEAGASIYSASKIAREEFPDLDVTVRGAISIARRLQDPLAELVRIEPKSIGVGQYQHDVNQKRLREGLHRTVVSCVNKVGVDLNTASVPLLRYVSGVQFGTAQNIVQYRTEHGAFKSRVELLDVDGIGPKVFEQCAGFLRIQDGGEPLDATAIHPEAYETVRTMAASIEASPKDLIGNGEVVKTLDLSVFESDTIGILALKDIKDELQKPGRDPRRKFEVPEFLEGVSDVKDLDEGMVLQGVVTNVTDFGAFVDVGVHQDGLVHLSELANRFVRDPREIVNVGDYIKVKVTSVDKETPRISLSIKALNPVSSKARTKKPASDSSNREGDRQSSSRRPQRTDRPRQASTNAQSKRGKRRSEKPKKSKLREASKEPLNTQMADQLASLKEKFPS
jgi:protein Tex